MISFPPGCSPWTVPGNPSLGGAGKGNPGNGLTVGAQ